MIIDFLAAALGRRMPGRYVGRHRAPEPIVPTDDESPVDLRVQQDETFTDGDSDTLVHPSTPR